MFKKVFWAVDIYTPEDAVIPFEFAKKAEALKEGKRLATKYYGEWPDGADACLTLKKFVTEGYKWNGRVWWEDDQMYMEEAWDVRPDGIYEIGSDVLAEVR